MSRMIRTFLSVSGFAFLILFFSCSKEKIDNGNSFRYKIKEYGKSKTFGDSTRSVSALIRYPEFDFAANKKAERSLNAFIDTLKLKPLADFAEDAEADGNLDSLTQRFFSEYRDIINEFEDYFIPWRIESNISPVFTGENVTTIKAEIFFQTGGAHPNAFVNYYSFELNSGKRLKLSDIFKPEQRSKLNKIAETVFRKEKNIPPDKSLKEFGYWFENNKFVLNDNFGILKDGIVFHFNAYEIAPYAMGHTEIIIPTEKINNLSIGDKWK